MASSQVSALRRPVSLPGGRFSATVRPANYEEALAFTTKVGSDKFEAFACLFDACVVESTPPARKMSRTPKFSMGMKVPKISGDDLTAEQIDEDDLSDEAAAMVVERQQKDPEAAFICIRMDERCYVFREPEPSRLDSFTKAKVKSAGIDTDLELVKQHMLFGDLEYLKRECPFALAELTRVVAAAGGLSVEAALGEA